MTKKIKPCVGENQTGLYRFALKVRRPSMERKSGIVKRIQQASQAIAQAPPTLAELAFTPRELVQATLPHRDPGNVPVWVRRNGQYGLSIQPGWDIAKNCSIGYPFGTLPRLLMFWLTAEAVRTNNKLIKLGESHTHFLKGLGLDPDRGGKCSDSFRVKNQWLRLTNAKISFQYWGNFNGKQHQSFLNLAIAERSVVWWEEKGKGRLEEEGGFIELTDRFFQAITQSPIPLDFRALQAIKNSPLAIDVYSWATLRAYAAQQKDKPHTVAWEVLLNQFGSDYRDVKDFKRYFKLALEKVQCVYPWLQFEYIKGGITIKPSSPSVSYRSLKKNSKLITAETSEKALLTSKSNHELNLCVSSKAFEEAVFLITNADTGWCKYALEKQFYDYARKKGIPKNVDKAFLGFVRKKVTQKP
ncbi:MAG: replication protein RepA [Nostoc sp. ChiQUE01b]|nr:replication protein RepA [Nostoc sp. ChiQUE01b]